jgi:hypothetical protein
VRVQRREAVADDPGAHQRSYGIVEEDLAVVVAQRRQGSQRGVVAGACALEDRGDLGVAAVADHRVHGVEVAGGHHHDDLVDVGVPVEDRQRVLHDRVTGDLDQLLGHTEAHPHADTSGQQYGHVPHELVTCALLCPA